MVSIKCREKTGKEEVERGCEGDCCLRYCPIGVKRHHDHSNLENKTFNWRLVYSLAVWSSFVMARSTMAGRQEDMVLEE